MARSGGIFLSDNETELRLEHIEKLTRKKWSQIEELPSSMTPTNVKRKIDSSWQLPFLC